MLFVSLGMVAPELVARQHYFLEEFTTPYVLWGIRGTFIVGGITALIIYFKMKNKRGE